MRRADLPPAPAFHRCSGLSTLEPGLERRRSVFSRVVDPAWLDLNSDVPHRATSIAQWLALDRRAFPEFGLSQGAHSEPRDHLFRGVLIRDLGFIEVFAVSKGTCANARHRRPNKAGFSSRQAHQASSGAPGPNGVVRVGDERNTQGIGETQVHQDSQGLPPVSPACVEHTPYQLSLGRHRIDEFSSFSNAFRRSLHTPILRPQDRFGLCAQAMRAPSANPTRNRGTESRDRKDLVNPPLGRLTERSWTQGVGVMTNRRKNGEHNLPRWCRR